ncbi:carbohydrate ABC transporter permease [Paenibacillus doosanensis]|uniref:L-arabinose transport system permease protein AraQ n=1 Tax=Paenibacillus konkukensis TaxID=2020716 RepID=A0ABY4RM36_9BACL|nr:MULTISPECIES: carbohydrate ABC transporter permease [Paenibacillus]MCS7460075.1 carbohydrate ABC transporter permease [Paenibacillus doosanensis]UQZ82729.1 L-arabinose transport system permease protein AraQ [Paenibacillus konkukensis]
MRESLGERIWQFGLNIVMLLLSIVTLYPFWHVLMYSLSDPKLAMGGGLFLWMKGFSLSSYEMLLHSKGIFQAYGNSIFRLVIGTAINIVFTAMLAYPLSVQRFVGRNAITLLIFFTMLFSGGMIPNYLIVKELGMINSLWSLIIPGAISAWNLIIMKNYFQSLPPELEESANIDGAAPMRILFSIILPVSAPVIAAIALFYGVAHWNSYFDAILYINSDSKQVLQVFLRTMLMSSSLQQVQGTENFASTIGLVTEESVKMATVVASVIPMLVVYPFLQKYYVKGVMIGSIKG